VFSITSIYRNVNDSETSSYLGPNLDPNTYSTVFVSLPMTSAAL
jgi:hypothetical protein